MQCNYPLKSLEEVRGNVLLPKLDAVFKQVFTSIYQDARVIVLLIMIYACIALLLQCTGYLTALNMCISRYFENVG